MLLHPVSILRRGRFSLNHFHRHGLTSLGNGCTQRDIFGQAYRTHAARVLRFSYLIDPYRVVAKETRVRIVDVNALSDHAVCLCHSWQSYFAKPDYEPTAGLIWWEMLLV